MTGSKGLVDHHSTSSAPAEEPAAGRGVSTSRAWIGREGADGAERAGKAATAGPPEPSGEEEPDRVKKDAPGRPR